MDVAEFSEAFKKIRRATENFTDAQIAYCARRINGEELIAARQAYAAAEHNWKLACKNRPRQK